VAVSTHQQWVLPLARRIFTASPCDPNAVALRSNLQLVDHNSASAMPHLTGAVLF